MHRRERRSRERREPRDDGVEDVVEDRLAVLVGGVGVREVAPGAEPASLAPHDERADARLFGFGEAAVQVRDHRGIDGVDLVGPVEDQLAASPLDVQQDGVTHLDHPRFPWGTHSS